MNFKDEASALLPEIQRHRRMIHQHPELSFREEKTTAYIQKELEALGIEVTRFDDYYGLIDTLRDGKKGKTVLLRADFVALPITEENEIP